MRERRFLWVVRTTMESREKIDQLLVTARKLSQTDLLVQINGRGESYYQSQILPPAKGLDFDPLSYVLERSRQMGIKIHGWINAFTVGSFTNPPCHSHHILNQYPDWVTVDRWGRSLWDYSPQEATEALPTFMLDPGLPEVQEHVKNVYLEVANTYDLDGIHFDYLRYPTADFGYHSVSCRRFEEEYGVNPREDLEGDSWETWQEWRRQQVTEVLRRIREDIRRHKPDLAISVAVYPDISDARNNKLQDWPTWLNGGELDFVLPMAYSPQAQVVWKQVEEIKEEVGLNGLYPGLGAYRLLHEPLELVEIIAGLRRLGCQGLALFSYDSLVSKGEVIAQLADKAFSDKPL